jgi:hypothetical protein
MIVTVPIPVTTEDQAALEAQARAQRVSMDSRDPVITPPLTEDFDRAFEEIADMIPDGVQPPSDWAVSRDSIYTREDKWNRDSR